MLSLLMVYSTTESNSTNAHDFIFSGELFPGQITIIVKTFGTVQFPNNPLKAFHQNFMLTSQNNVWKIVSDNFRFQDKSDS